MTSEGKAEGLVEHLQQDSLSDEPGNEGLDGHAVTLDLESASKPETSEDLKMPTENVAQGSPVDSELVDSGPVDADSVNPVDPMDTVDTVDTVTSGPVTADPQDGPSAVRSSIELAISQPTSQWLPGRDRYGFKKKTNFVSEQAYDRWWASYEPYLKRRKRKWIKLMKDNGLSVMTDDKEQQPVRFPPKSDKLKRYIRKGIPAEWRGNAWFWYAKGHEKLNSHPGVYDKLSKQTQNLKNNDTELIERDLHRTFPDNIYFRSDPPYLKAEETPLVQSLRRVLVSVSVYRPKIGYCQSLNFIAGILLLFLDEEKSFWMLVIITQRYLPGVHDINLEGVNVDQGVLMVCVRKCLPHMWEKLGVGFDGVAYDNFLTKLPPITLCTASWFMSAFISILPTETMLRVWDCFFFEESRIFFRTALTLFKLVSPTIETLKDQMEIFQVVQNFPKQMIDANYFLQQCFKLKGPTPSGHFTQEYILKLREFVSTRRQLSQDIDKRDSEVQDQSSSPKVQSDLEELQQFDGSASHFKVRSGLHLSARFRNMRVSTNSNSSISKLQKRLNY